MGRRGVPLAVASLVTAVVVGLVGWSLWPSTEPPSVTLEVTGGPMVFLAVAKGKQLQHKRETLRRREIGCETRAAVKARQR